MGSVTPFSTAHNAGDSRRYSIFDIARVCCVVVLLLHSLGYASALWAWMFCVVSWLVLCEPGVRIRHLTPLDYAMISLWLFEILSIPASSYPSNGWLYVEQVTIAVSIYFSLSRLQSRTGLSFLILFFGAVTVLFVASDMTHFLDRYAEWKQLRFGNIGDVKRTLTVVDTGTAGVHYTVYLCFLAWGLAGLALYRPGPRFLRWIAILVVTGSAIGIILSLSRGLYLGTFAGACCIGALFLGKPVITSRTAKMTVAIAAALVLVTAGFFVRTDIPLDLLSFLSQNTTSKYRSTQGRLFIWQRALQLGEAKPWMGFGAHTFPLYGARAMTQEEGETIDRAFSLPVQVFFERGLIGLFLYAGFFIVVFRAACTNVAVKKRLQTATWSLSWAAATGLACLLIRELTFTTLFDDNAVTFGAFSLIGLIRTDQGDRLTSDHEPVLRRAALEWIALGIIIIPGLVVGCHRIRRAMSDFYSTQAVEADSMHDSKSASDKSLRAFSLLPTPYSQAQAGLFLAKSAGIKMGEQGLPVFANDGFDKSSLATKAESLYVASLNAFPEEAGWQHNLAWLLWVSGEHASAVRKASYAADLEPSTALYRQSLIAMLIAESKSTRFHDQLVTLLIRCPEVVDSHWWKGISGAHAEVTQSALHDAISALDVDPRQSPIRTARRARLYMEAGDLDSAESLLHTALLSLPGLSGAWRSYALILARHRQWNLAAEALERAVFLNPWDCAGYYALSQVVLQLGVKNNEEHEDLMRISSMFHAKAFRIQTAIHRSPESLRAYREFGAAATAPDDLVVDGLLQFCMPDMTWGYAKIVQ